MSDTPEIGMTISANDIVGRDAIHVAVVPLIATETLHPGQRVGLHPESVDHASASGASCGIVDPFLASPVQKGQRFYLFLYPGTVTSLRHEWTHPLFDEKDES